MAKIERTKNASRNIVFGSLLQMYKLLVPFLMRTVIIYKLGMEYLGLSSLFTSVLQVLNMAELGVGSAMVYSMYRPIAEDDSVTVCALMKLYRLYYRVIGLIVAVAGGVITPFIPRLIKGDVPADMNVYVLYLLSLAATVLSYWLFAYKNSILMAHQRTDVASKITLGTMTFQYALQFIVLWFFRNYYYYVIATLVAQVLTNVITAFFADRMYPQFKAKGKLPQEEVSKINRRIRDLFSAKFGTVLGISVDSIVISAFIGLTALGIYQNYHFIMTAVESFFIILFTSVRAGIGNSLVVESEEKNYNDFRKLGFMILWAVTVCIACFSTMYQPFVRLWVGTKNLLPNSMVILFGVYFFLVVIQHLSTSYKDAAGIWHEDRFRPLIAGLVNLACNIVLVRFWGLPGILLSTIISYALIAVPWVIHNLFRLVFKRSPADYILLIVKGFLLAGVIAAICNGICYFIPLHGILQLLVNAVVAVAVSNLILFLVYRRTESFRQMLSYTKRLIRRR